MELGCGRVLGVVDVSAGWSPELAQRLQEASRTIEVEKPDLVPFVASLRTTPASGSAGELNYHYGDGWLRCGTFK